MHPIFTTWDIEADDEILDDYGEDYWKGGEDDDDNDNSMHNKDRGLFIFIRNKVIPLNLNSMTDFSFFTIITFKHS